MPKQSRRRFDDDEVSISVDHELADEPDDEPAFSTYVDATHGPEPIPAWVLQCTCSLANAGIRSSRAGSQISTASTPDCSAHARVRAARPSSRPASWMLRVRWMRTLARGDAR